MTSTADDLRAVKCPGCGHWHTPEGCVGPPTPSDQWAGVSPTACDCPLTIFDVLAASDPFDQARAEARAEFWAGCETSKCTGARDCPSGSHVEGCFRPEADLDEARAEVLRQVADEMFDPGHPIDPAEIRQWLRNCAARFGGDPS